jgi:hypothetical protein
MRERGNKMFVAVTAFGETREIEITIYPSGIRAASVGRVVVGRFPTGTKLHRSQLTLWKRHQERGGKVYSSRGETAAVIDGEEYVADGTLYTHNRNVGRIVGWYDEEVSEEVVARW